MTTEHITLFDIQPDPPALPYGGTSGWSGSDTSMERAIEADRSGKTSKRQMLVIEYLQQRKRDGLTWKELSDLTGWHHGTASGALSVLHKAKIIDRLSQTRNRCQIYVLPDFVEGRVTHHYRPNASTRILLEILDEIEGDLLEGHIAKVLSRIRATREAFQ